MKSPLPSSKYCTQTCQVEEAKARKEDKRLERIAKGEPIRRVCQLPGCNASIEGRNAAAKYCKPSHRVRMSQLKAKEQSKQETVELGKRLSREQKQWMRLEAEKPYRETKTVDTSVSRNMQTRRGNAYLAFVEAGFPELIESAQATQRDTAKVIGVHESVVSSWMAAWREDREVAEARDGWTRAEDVERALLALKPFMERFHPALDYAPYYDEWEGEVDGVVGTGGRLVLLAPQRHSKTEFLLRYCQRRIAANPDICILWVSRSKELAEESVGMLRQLLEDEEFSEAVLGPGETFKPQQRSGKPWTDERFTVDNRTTIRKSPTVRAVGIGGTMSGRDADLIIVDDPQEREDCESPTTREKQARWFFTTLMARKMEHTGVAFITSRRHVEDIPGKIIHDHGDDWRVVTYRAHDPLCTLDPQDFDLHTGCVLWPKMRSYRFLMGQKRADPEFFECNYQNDPSSEGLVLITPEDLARCRDSTRRVGVIPKEVTRLVAGIDPADAKPVAAVLLGWSVDGRRHLIDLMEAEPSIRGGRQIVRTFHTLYGVTTFVLEKNMALSWWQDTDLRDYTARNGIRLLEHYTGAHNKMHPSTGVPMMFQRMRRDPPDFILPYAEDRQTRDKMERFQRTLLSFDPDYVGSKHADDDLPMAAWFADHHMRTFTTKTLETAEVDYAQTPYVSWRTSYPARDLERTA